MYWKEISAEEFLPYFCNIRVNYYLVKLSELGGVRKYIIKSNGDQKNILEPSFLPDYKDQKLWKSRYNNFICR